MKRINTAILLMLVALTGTLARHLPGSRHLTVTGGWSVLNIEESSNSAGGFETAGSFEQTSFNGHWAYGAALSFIRVTDDVASARAIKIRPERIA